MDLLSGTAKNTKKESATSPGYVNQPRTAEKTDLSKPKINSYVNTPASFNDTDGNRDDIQAGGEYEYADLRA